MSTNNFINHENGIYVLEQRTEQELKEGLLESGYQENEITEEFLQEERNFCEEMDCRELFSKGCGLNYWLEEKGYQVEQDKNNEFKARVFSKQGKVVADLILESGYYSGVQVIVETDPYKLFEMREDGYYYGYTMAEVREEYTPNHKRLLKAIAQYTIALEKVGQFSNGEAVYEYA